MMEIASSYISGAQRHEASQHLKGGQETPKRLQESSDKKEIRSDLQRSSSSKEIQLDPDYGLITRYFVEGQEIFQVPSEWQLMARKSCGKLLDVKG